jgi:leader peptidase (prepilin peptidase)/N-methyltransferase
MAASIVLAVALAALSAIDLQSHRLPDVLTLPLIAAGLLVSLWIGGVPAWWPLLSAALGFLLLAGIAFVYQHLRGRAGLGLGDAKLVAAAGAWLGAGALPTVLLWATGAALVCVLITFLRDPSLTRESRIPFGPFLGFGTWLVWLYGPL